MSDLLISDERIIWKYRIGKRGIFQVAVNIESPQCKQLAQAIRSRGKDQGVSDGFTYWLMSDGKTPARREQKDER